MWFNKRHRRAGHLFQRRFKSCIVEDDHGWQEVARYVHLNLVRLGRLGLNKSQQAWLCTEPLSRLCGGRTEAERRAALRQYTEQPVRQGDGVKDDVYEKANTRRDVVDLTSTRQKIRAVLV